MADPFDPSEWDVPDTHTHCIYTDDRAQCWAVVDYEDYLWAVQWKWKLKAARGGRKFYVCRTASFKDSTGKWRDSTWFLHVEIMKRTGIQKPTPFHDITDHRDGVSLNCRRYNLRWATASMNRRNINGQHPIDLLEYAYGTLPTLGNGGE
jgi:hypothetical protein